MNAEYSGRNKINIEAADDLDLCITKGGGY